MPQAFSEEKKQQWKESILKQRGSGLSIEKWCLKNNVAAHTGRISNLWVKLDFLKLLKINRLLEIDFYLCRIT